MKEITITIAITFVLKHPQTKQNPFECFHVSIFLDNKQYEWMQ